MCVFDVCSYWSSHPEHCICGIRKNLFIFYYLKTVCLYISVQIKTNLVINLLGDLAPHYGRPLIGVFLSGTRDEDSSVRASSLSNLGELCQLLNFSLGPLAQEVVPL